MLIRSIVFSGLLFLWFTARAQKKESPFQKEWLDIDTLILQKDLTRTALDKTKLLYQKAKKAHLTDQAIKCLIYEYTLEERITDNDPNKLFNRILSAIRSADNETEKAILHSLLAKQYLQYYNNYRWRLYNRKPTSDSVKNDIATWSADDLNQAITKNFLASLKNKALLQQNSLSDYEAIIIPGNSRQFRPTLFDLLVHEALDYFGSGENYLNKPMYAFVVSDPRALDHADSFMNTVFTAKDSSSQEWIALELYQSLLRFHKKDIDQNAFVHTDIERIQWVYEHAVFADKEKRYVAALEKIKTTDPKLTASAEAWYLLARIEADKAGSYQPFTDTANRYGYVKARALVTEALQIFSSKKEALTNLEILLENIDRTSISSTTEAINVPGKPFRCLLNYRNVDTIYQRIIKLNLFASIPNWTEIAKLPVYQQYQQLLPAVSDHQQHSVEMKIDALPVGYYALLSSTSKNFEQTKDHLSLTFFKVSNISYLRNGDDYFVVKRDNGQPLENAEVSFMPDSYSGLMTAYVKKNMIKRTTDKNGHFIAKDDVYKNNDWLVFQVDKDSLVLNKRDIGIYGNYFYNPNTPTADADKYEKDNTRIFFFTDRSIYRPGQPVYFKGIGVTRDFDSKLSKLISSKDSGWVYLYNANGKKIDSLKIGLNSYGSFSGKFHLPETGLTGIFSIQAPGYHYSVSFFSVEEYKRPKFTVSFEKNSAAYRLNDSITVTGIARAFAGNNIDGAKVNYTVKRVLYAARSRKSYLPVPNSNTAIISHGESETDINGNFQLHFKASADDVNRTDDMLRFNFIVEADITDINGETHSASISIPIGYRSLVLEINNPDIIDTDSLDQINIVTRNLSNEQQKALVKVSISPLTAPNRLIRKRYWQRPDQFVYTEKEFTGYFPTDEYQNESDYQTWPVEQAVATGMVNTAETDFFKLTPGSLLPGYYQIEASTTDSFGTAVSETAYLQVFSRKKNQAPVTGYQFSYPGSKTTEPGSRVVFLSASAANETYVISQTENRNQQRSDFRFEYRPAGMHATTYLVEEKDRAGVGMSEVYVYDNRIYTNQFNLSVPWTNKNLHISYASYRNKTEPGAKEQWTVTVEGSKGEQKAAELLTTMYDASLDAFKKHTLDVPDIWNSFLPENHFSSPANFRQGYSTQNSFIDNYRGYQSASYDQLIANADVIWDQNFSNWENDQTSPVYNKVKLLADFTSRERMLTGRVAGVAMMKSSEGMLNDQVVTIRGKGVLPPPPTNANIDGTPIVQVRKDFNETAFFFPQLYADSTGKYRFSFTMPEALTQWKWLSLAHTKDLAFGVNSTTIITQKKLMVQPNPPRFLREGDNMEFSSKIVNMSDSEITGQVRLELIDPATNTSVDGWFQNVFPTQYFTVAAGKSFAVKFPIEIPFSYNKPLTWRVTAYAGAFSDAEENVLPVLTNRVLVTESLPLFLPSDTTLQIRFDKLLHSNSETLTQEGITVEYSSNPVWNAIQALPYLMEYPYECAEQSFNRFYANALASFVVNKYPQIRKVFELWKADSTAFNSNLQKNETLKQVLLAETPWVLQAENEAAQKKNIALLFDLVKLSNQTNELLDKLTQLQLPDGSFSWFKGGYPDTYITSYIITGFGKLKRLGVLSSDISIRISNLLLPAIKYMDKTIDNDYQQLIKNKADLSKQQIGFTEINYLYMRSFFRDIAQQSPTAYHYFYQQGKQFWVRQSTYDKAKLGIVFYRTGEERFVNASILPALLENAIRDPKLGTYWKSTYAGFWYQSPIEFQSLLISSLSEINMGLKDAGLDREINSMKTWLLLNKQTNHWRTTVATADACYALLLNGANWLDNRRTVSIQLGNYLVNSNNEQTEAGTGYFKKRIDGKQVVPEMGNITVSTKPEAGSTNGAGLQSPSWGAVYWQYLEQMDKVTSASSPLSLVKQLFVEKNTDKGKLLEPVKEGDELKIGDKIIVRLELRTDRDMDYLHLKDLRAATMEPVNVLSGYKWGNGFGYYESTKDVSSNFFISHLSKGTYVFDYPLFITHSGIFSVGIASIQCMYAPEFGSHSEGIKIRVAN